jgi:hypothetical protein
MPVSNRLKAIRNAAKMRVRGYRNSGNKTPNGLTIWTKTVNGVTKRKTANGTPVNNGTTTNNIKPMNLNYAASYTGPRGAPAPGSAWNVY